MGDNHIMTKKKPTRAPAPKKPARRVEPPSAAAIWLASHGTMEGIGRLHDAAHAALSLLLALEQMSAVRLPFAGFEQAKQKLAEALK